MLVPNKTHRYVFLKRDYFSALLPTALELSTLMKYLQWATRDFLCSWEEGGSTLVVLRCKTFIAIDKPQFLQNTLIQTLIKLHFIEVHLIAELDKIFTFKIALYINI